MTKEQGLYASFFEYITEKDDIVAVGKKAAFERSLMSVREEWVEGLDTIEERKRALFGSRNNAPTGNYFEYEIAEMEFCCDELQKKEGTTDLVVIANRVEGEGLNRLWYCNCTFCGTPLILSRTHLRIDKT